jgi:LPXTG-motif cell wall-anchored protein
MRWKLPAGVLMALALLVPAAPALAQTETTGLDASCQTVERKVFKDIRELVTIDLDTATDVQVRILADQILYTSDAESLPTLPDAVQAALDGSKDDLRAFLKSSWQNAWTADLRISVFRTLTGAGTNVQTAAQKALDGKTIDALLAYLNDGLYAARALDCASHSTPPQHSSSPTATASPTTTGGAIPASSPSASASGGGGGGLPVTGAATGTAVAVGGALLLLGAAAYVLTRRRRSRFVA